MTVNERDSLAKDILYRATYIFLTKNFLISLIAWATSSCMMDMYRGKKMSMYVCTHIR